MPSLCYKLKSVDPSLRLLRIRRARAGFSVVEAITALVVASILATLMGTAFSLMSAVDSSEAIESGGRVYQPAPSIAAMREAALLHQRLVDAITEAEGVFVFGGNLGTPLAWDYGDLTLAAFPSCGIENASNSAQFASVNSAQFAGNWEDVSSGSLSGFTVLCVRTKAPSLLCIAQSRREVVVNAGRSMVLYRVRLTDGDGTLAYQFYVPLEGDTWVLNPGAYHAWFRQDAGWRRYEEGPCTVAFPDPYMLSGQTGSTLPSSRFVYFVQ